VLIWLTGRAPQQVELSIHYESLAFPLAYVLTWCRKFLNTEVAEVLQKYSGKLQIGEMEELHV